MIDFEALWRSSVRFRRVSRELHPLLREVHGALVLGDPAAVRVALERLLLFLSGTGGRTDANCTTTYYFFSGSEELWRALPAEITAILDDMSGTLHDTVYAPDIARTFEALPEQLLERVRRL